MVPRLNAAARASTVFFNLFPPTWTSDKNTWVTFATRQAARSVAQRRIRLILDENFLPPFADGGQQSEQKQDQGDQQKPRADRAIQEDHQVAARDDQGPAEVLLHESPEDEAEEHRGGLEPEFHQRIADHPE